MAASLDGFIATEDDSLDWLFSLGSLNESSYPAFIAEVGEGSRKDIRNAVEAAHKAGGWAKATSHNRAQVLYYIAENLAARGEEFAARIAAMTGTKNAGKEVQASIERLFYYAAWADKYDGLAHQPPMHGVTVALNEPVGVL